MGRNIKLKKKKTWLKIYKNLYCTLLVQPITNPGKEPMSRRTLYQGHSSEEYLRLSLGVGLGHCNE